MSSQSSVDAIGILRVFTDPAGSIVNPFSPSPRYVNLAPNDHDFRLLKAVIHLGMSMLESPWGRQILVDIGINVVNTYRGQRQPCLYVDHVDNMVNYAPKFLQVVRADFFNVYLTKVMQFQSEGESQSSPWGNDIRHYKPKNDGRLKFNRTVIENLRNAALIVHNLKNRADPASRARQANAVKNFEAGAFLMGITVAHQVVHKWIRYLLGVPTAGTPPHIAFPGTQSIDGGESGWYWEARFLGGGRVVCYEDPHDPLGWQQLGKLYLIRHTATGPKARELSHSYIQDVLGFNFTVPVRTSSIERNMNQLGKLMERLRLERLGAAGIPINGAPEADALGRIPSWILAPINRMAKHNVRVAAPIRPSSVLVT